MQSQLKEKAKVNQENAMKKKDNHQNVRLWLNQITPDNFKKKESELRGLLFGNRISLEEEGFEQ